MSFRGNRRPLLVGMVITALVIIGAAGCGSDTTSTSDRTTTTEVVVTTSSPSDSIASSTTGDGSAVDATSTVPPTTSAPTTAKQSPAPETPTGPFLSSHELSLGASQPTTAQSVCHTTPGAVCQVVFTKGSTVEKLPAQTTDAQGRTSWVWSPDQVGLTTGHWDVEVVAGTGASRSGATDVMGMKVVP